MQVFLIRHSRPLVAADICYGQLDLPAVDIADTAATLIAQLPPALPVVSSPLQRCRLLAEALHPSPRIEANLMEMHFGEWEGKSWDEIGREAIDAWCTDLLHHAPPGGESAATLQARTVACLNRLAAEGLPACVVVTHAGVMRAAIGHARKLDPVAWAQWSINYGECIPLEWPTN